MRIRYPEGLIGKLVLFLLAVAATVAVFVVLKIYVMDDVRCAVTGCHATKARIDAAHASADNFTYGCTWLAAALTLLLSYDMALPQNVLLSKYFPVTRRWLVRPVFGFGRLTWLDFIEKILFWVMIICFLGALTAYAFFVAAALPVAIHY